MSHKQRKILVTSALPYANGSIHLGHILEYIQADIFVRFQKMQGHECYLICGNDSHGTPIMLAAEKQGISPEELITKVGQEQYQDIIGFYVNFDNFYSTHSRENQELSSEIFLKLKARGDIQSKTIEQAFDPEKNMFLPDRYVKGECPKCGTTDQYGDSCESCGATYSPMEMKNPVSALSGVTPVRKASEHLFFQLDHYREKLVEWTHSGTLQSEVLNKINEWLNDELLPWDITRDAPYFGFEIPGYPEKYFYVWLDAPVGYIASFKNYCERHPEVNFDEFWRKDSDAELYHFIGKDITYFHALFWPAMLMGSDYRTPNGINVHGFLTVNGQKMSKSRGTFINARNYLDHLNPEALRYYFAAKLNANVEDVDLNLEDFINRVNSDLVGKVVNIASRCAGFIHKKFAGNLSEKLDYPELFDQLSQKSESIAVHYESRDFARAIREIMEMADQVNQYIDEKKPWSLAKDESQLNLVHEVCTSGLNLFRLLMIYLKPVLPKMAEQAESFLNIESLNWNDAQKALLSHEINYFTPLMTRVEKEKVDAIKS